MAVSPTSAEVILPDARSCTLPDLPYRRFGHTQSGSENLTASLNDFVRIFQKYHSTTANETLLLCAVVTICYILRSGYSACGGAGGGDDTRTCHTFTAGRWEQSHALAREGQWTWGRAHHVSWRSPLGTLLIGGWDYDAGAGGGRLTTELLSTTDSSTTELFTLLNATKYK